MFMSPTSHIFPFTISYGTFCFSKIITKHRDQREELGSGARNWRSRRTEQQSREGLLEEEEDDSSYNI
jgi:hypothetical protein